MDDVRVTVQEADGLADAYSAEVLSYTNYYAFGMAMPGRNVSSDTYRYGFNGKEKDTEGMGGGGSTYDYGFRIYNPQIAKFLSVDPLTKSYPWYTPYQFAGNKPVVASDLDGLEERIEIVGIDKSGRAVLNDVITDRETIERFYHAAENNIRPELGITHPFFPGKEQFFSSGIAPLKGVLRVGFDADGKLNYDYNPDEAVPIKNEKIEKSGPWFESFYGHSDDDGSSPIKEAGFRVKGEGNLLGLSAEVEGKLSGRDENETKGTLNASIVNKFGKIGPYIDFVQGKYISAAASIDMFVTFDGGVDAPDQSEWSFSASVRYIKVEWNQTTRTFSIGFTTEKASVDAGTERKIYTTEDKNE